jgi:molybdopterin-guanine dinucleotide biosynthesis protein A
MNVSIALLAGGQSRRLGVDKAMLRLIDGGPTLLERTAAICAGLTDDLFVVAPAERGYEATGLRIVADRFPGQGPAGGVITALGAARHACCLVLGCDYPHLSRPLVRWLIELADADRPVLPRLPEAGRQGGDQTLEVLHGVYPVAALAEIERGVAGGERQLARLVLNLRPRLLTLEAVLRFDPGLRSFRSVNRHEDVAWARQALADRSPSGAVRRSS